jgi:predicted transcriptional regulator
MCLFFSQMLSDYLSSCWLSPKEIEIFLKVFQYGPKTATQLSHITGIERTNCYKIINKLSGEWLINSGEKNGVKQFRVEKSDSIKTYLENKKKWLEKLSNSYDQVEFEFQKLRSKPESSLPKIRLFEQSHWLDSLYKSMESAIHAHWCTIIQMYALNTLESTGIQNNKVVSMAQDFYSTLYKMWVKVELRQGIWINTIEDIQYSHSLTWLASLSHWLWSSQIRVIWPQLFMILFKEIPVAIKIESPELSYMVFALLQKR